MVDDIERVHPIDRAVYESGSPRVAVEGTRYGHGRCTVLWIKVSDGSWVLLPHGVPNLAVHLTAQEFVAMLDGLRAKMWRTDQKGRVDMPDKDDDAKDEVKDGGRHDVGRDGQTGKTADGINPDDYKPKRQQ